MPDLVASNVYEFTPLAECSGQSVNTVLHYLWSPDQADPIQELTALAAMINVWETNIVPLLATGYTVQQYELKQVTGVGLSATGVPSLTTNAATVVPGDASGVSPAGIDGLPTYVTATFRKNSSGVSTTEYRPVLGAILAGEKRFRGRIGISPIAESNTQLTNVNLFTNGAYDALDDAMDPMVSIPVQEGLFTGTMRLVIVSLIKGAAVRISGGGVPLFAFQLVDGFTLNPYVGSQLSRKYTGPA